jgi:TPP-dependent 2-oxoacid decarboxylase
MQFLTLNQGYTKFNVLVRHNIKYDQINSWNNDCAVTVFGTKDEYCLDHKNTKNWSVI